MIGGCLPLECGKRPFFHKNAFLLNSGRNALRLFLRKTGIEKIFVPIFTCPVVVDAVKSENVTPVFYDLNEDLSPSVKIEENDFLLMNNRFGLTYRLVEQTVKKHPKTIVDSAQSFYAPATGLADIYSPRKFFGLPDGGALVCPDLTHQDEPKERDFSYDRSSHLLISADLDSQKAEDDFAKNDDDLNGFPVMKISRLTESLLGNIDYDFVKLRRLSNFDILHKNLKTFNRLSLTLTTNDVPMFYPYLTEHPLKARQKLLKKGIDTAIYWPAIDSFCEKNTYSIYLRDHIVPLPLDQRYEKNDMERILSAILN